MNTTSLQQPLSHAVLTPVGGGRLRWPDGLFGLVLVTLVGYITATYRPMMDVYSLTILWCCVPFLVFLGWRWPALRFFSLGCGALAYAAISLYAGELARGQEQFLLKYLLSSQSAILWMCALYAFATIAYWAGLLTRGQTALWMGSVLTWAASVFGLVGLLVRWHETYLISPDVGYIPVSNLYEVFILFALITGMFYLYYERRYQTRSLGGFVSLVIVAAVGFLLWYMATRSAHEIQPLVPALQSWWMKIHVPANFVGYGTFSIAAMVAFAYLVKVNADNRSWKSLAPLFVLGVLLCAEPLVFRRAGLPDYWAIYFGVAAVFVGGVLALRKRLAEVLPSLEVLDDIQYRAIAIGFAFFTVATILGALWAAEAWGTYWQWDPKETWALIVWLNYAAWLHLRLMKGLRGQFAAYWSLVGLLITGFAFLGVNMFLSGLHSYGQL
ncbi:MAG: c-type cytochrome biogenesis protein CcsB [Betaproteobacteria bacterium]|jgi:cytochrome c-type biogenesis protein CcsB|nr:c-type cytochrome biogenesis protein CcsB [Betaproteobacteria bacterium]